MKSTKTRAILKRELSSSIPDGEEASFLASAAAALEESRRQLQKLRAERAALRRQISIRERKRQDWKGKVPRPAGDPGRTEALAELARCGVASCRCVASIQLRNERSQLRFFDDFKAALSGLAGFAKLWIVAVAPAWVGVEMGRCCGGEERRNVYLWLVDVEAVDVKEGVVQIVGMNFEFGEDALKEILVLDVKPYLPYCEAWPLDPKEESQLEECSFPVKSA